MPEGLVLKSTGSWYNVLLENGEQRKLRMRGKIRLGGVKSTNPIAVGDRVEIDLDSETILGLVARKNYIIRRSNNLSKYSHIIAANIDQALLIVSYAQPRTSQGFIDRFLITCEAYDIPVTLILNKTDLLSEEDEAEARDLMEMYDEAGYEVLYCSVKDSAGLVPIKSLLDNKVSLLSGHSGVGKSSMVNALFPGLDIRVGEISSYHEKGQHTTTFAEMHQLAEKTFIIDTPGIKDFGLVRINREELSDYFPDLFEWKQHCKFNNCLHLNEPGCAVYEAAKEGHLDPRRYMSYLNILEGDQDMNTPKYIWKERD